MECRRRVQRNDLSHTSFSVWEIVSLVGRATPRMAESRVIHITLAGLDSVQCFVLGLFYFSENTPNLHNILYFYTINCFFLFFLVFIYRYNILCKNIIYYVNINVFIIQKILEKVKLWKLHIKLYFFHFVSE